MTNEYKQVLHSTYMKAELKRRPSGRQIRTWASHCFLFADSKDKGCHLPKNRKRNLTGPSWMKRFSYA